MAKDEQTKGKISSRVCQVKSGVSCKNNKANVKICNGYEKTFQQKYFKSSWLSNACLKLFTNPQTCRLVSKHVLQLQACKCYCILQTEIKIDKIVRTRNKNGINQHLVKRKGYDEILNIG